MVKYTQVAYFLLFIFVFFTKSTVSQHVPTLPLKQHSVGFLAGYGLNTFSKKKPYSFEEYTFCVFYKYNRFGVSAGLATMKNLIVTGNDERKYVCGLSVSFSVDLFRFNKIVIPLSLYSNIYRYRYNFSGLPAVNISNNGGCKIGIDYQPFKPPFKIYLYGGANYYLRKQNIEDPQRQISSNSQSKLVEVIELGLKYTIMSKRKS